MLLSRIRRASAAFLALWFVTLGATRSVWMACPEHRGAAAAQLGSAGLGVPDAGSVAPRVHDAHAGHDMAAHQMDAGAHAQHGEHAEHGKVAHASTAADAERAPPADDHGSHGSHTCTCAGDCCCAVTLQVLPRVQLAAAVEAPVAVPAAVAVDERRPTTPTRYLLPFATAPPAAARLS